MKKYFPYFFLIIAVIFFISNFFQKLSYSPDDTYIYMQYARNIASGNGFAFNAGEPSYGITSPLWSLMLAGGYVFGIDGYWFAKSLDLLFVILSAIIFYKLCGFIFSGTFQETEKPKTLQLLALSVFLINTWFIRWSFTGMETTFAVFLVLSVFYLLFNQKYYWGFALLGILFLVRPESFILFFLSVFYLFFNKAGFKKILLSVFIYALITSAFLIYARLSFGTIFPNTTLGKATFSFGPGIWIEQVKRIAQTIAFSSIVELLLSCIFIAYMIKNRKWNYYAFMILWIACLIALYIITDADIISRYLLIIIPLITLTGIASAGLSKSKYLVFAVIVFVVSTAYSQFMFYKYVKPQTDNFSYGVKNCFMEIGGWLNQNTPKNSKILVNDVGAIGYYSNRYIIDAAALINRDLNMNQQIMQTPVKEREVTANLLNFIQADYLVERDSEKGNNLNAIGNYKLEFILEKEFPSLGISDPNPKYYKIYKVILKN